MKAKLTYIFNEQDKIEEKINNRFIFLFLDFDGTLAPIVSAPRYARMPAKTKNLLRNLAKKRRVKLAIVSGRALNDLKKAVGIKNIIYAGNHGLEAQGAGVDFKQALPAVYIEVLRDIKRLLRETFSKFKGILIEDKRLTISFHYRRVLPGKEGVARRQFYKIVNPLIKKSHIKICEGKKVFEIRPLLRWNKGKLVSLLCKKEIIGNKRSDILPIYIGDDTTDEDAFKVIKNGGLSIFVGKPKKTNARYYLKGPYDVTRFLEYASKRTV